MIPPGTHLTDAVRELEVMVYNLSGRVQTLEAWRARSARTWNWIMWLTITSVALNLSALLLRVVGR